MPVVRERCDSCGSIEHRCPTCGSKYVTKRDDMQQKSPNDLVDFSGAGSDGVPYTQQYKHICWSCGWTENVTVTVQRDEEEPDAITTL